MSQKPEQASIETEAAAPEAVTTVQWDGSGMATSYANVVNVINTREEFSLFFGMNHTVDVNAAGGLTVKLANRIMMTPHAAKRLSILLAGRVAEYEAKFGALNVTGPQ
jgi:hypothetical protein